MGDKKERGGTFSLLLPPPPSGSFRNGGTGQRKNRVRPRPRQSPQQLHFLCLSLPRSRLRSIRITLSAGLLLFLFYGFLPGLPFGFGPSGCIRGRRQRNGVPGLCQEASLQKNPLQQVSSAETTEPGPGGQSGLQFPISVGLHTQAHTLGVGAGHFVLIMKKLLCRRR